MRLSLTSVVLSFFLSLPDTTNNANPFLKSFLTCLNEIEVLRMPEPLQLDFGKIISTDDQKGDQ